MLTDAQIITGLKAERDKLCELAIKHGALVNGLQDQVAALTAERAHWKQAAEALEEESQAESRAFDHANGERARLAEENEALKRHVERLKEIANYLRAELVHEADINDDRADQIDVLRRAIRLIPEPTR